MIITVVCDVLGEENNGTTVATMNLIRHLKKNHTVRIVCADQDKRGMENYYVVERQSFGKPLNALVARVGVTIAKPDNDIITEALTGADHVHLMLPLFLGIHAAKIARAMDLPMTAGFHMQAENLTSYFKLQGLRIVNNQVYRFIYRHFYRYVDAIHYPTEFIRNMFESRIGHRTHGYVISNGVQNYVGRRPTERPAELKDKIVISSVGRLAYEKSQDTLIKAVARSAYKDRIHLILAGQGLKEKKYRRLAERLGVSADMRLFPREEVVDILNYSDLYVHPAVIELEGIACLEAIACGTMTIVSDSKNSATKGFAIDDKCIFKHRNPKDLARVIDYWISHPKERAEYADKYLEGSDCYRQDDCMRRMEEMIVEISNKKRYSEE